MSSVPVTPIQQALDRLRANEQGAKEELFRVSMDRLWHLAHRMLQQYPRVRRREETDDVLQEALLSLSNSLAEVPLESTCQYLYFAAAQIRRRLIDLARHHATKKSMEGNCVTPDADRPGSMVEACAASSSNNDPSRLLRWREFHEAIERMPLQEREVWDLVWYHKFSQDEVARLLNISVRTVKRRWNKAGIWLFEAMDGEPPR